MILIILINNESLFEENSNLESNFHCVVFSEVLKLTMSYAMTERQVIVKSNRKLNMYNAFG